MVRIIKQGQKPEDKVVRSTCTNCRTEFEYTLREAKKVSDYRESYHRIACPYCGAYVLHYSSSSGDYYGR